MTLLRNLSKDLTELDKIIEKDLPPLLRKLETTAFFGLRHQTMNTLGFAQKAIIAEWEPRITKLIKDMTQQEYSELRKTVGINKAGLFNISHTLKTRFKRFSDKDFTVKTMDLREEGNDL